MGRILNTLTVILCCITLSNAQCPDLANNVLINSSSQLEYNLCGEQTPEFTVNDVNLPNGTIDWYSSTTSGFDPLTSGTPLGSNTISNAPAPCDPGGCPTIEVIYIDACGPGDESLNEFMVIGSGSGFAVNDLSVMFDDNNTFGSVGNENINIGSFCSWKMGDENLFSGCSSLIPVGPGDFIPPNSAVIIQTSDADFMTTIYDVSGLCGVSDCIYVLSNSCDRNVGAFSNCGGGTGSGSTRNNEISLTCGCNDVLVYDILDPMFVAVCAADGGAGMHVFSDLTYANNLCNNGPNLGSIPQFSSAATVTPFSNMFTQCNSTQYVVGVLNSSEYNEECCGEQITNEYTFNISCPTAELDQTVSGDLCPGDCVEILVDLQGGNPPYDLDLTFSGLPFPFNDIMIPLPGFPVGEKVTICYDAGGPLLDAANFTVDIPAIAAGFSGALTLNSFTDFDGCIGMVLGSPVSVSFNAAPVAISPPTQTACDMGGGTAFFILSNLDNIINGGSGASVSYFSDMDGMIPISDPYNTGTTTIYAQVLGTPCDSEIVPVDLEVIENGDAGLVTLFCGSSSGPSTECTICDDDGISGANVTLTILFEDPSINYDYEVVWTASSGPSSTIIGTSIGDMATFDFNIFETTTFQVTLVTPDGDCPDMTDLGDPVVINYGILPQIDNPGDLSNCGPVILPEIMGSSIPPNAGYYTMQNGMGTQYTEGDMISSSTTLYLYGGFEDCELEIEIDVTIESSATIDDPANVIECGSYVLPTITGTNVDNAMYYTAIDGGGSIIPVGTVITNSIVLYLYDPACGGNQPTLDITITAGPAFTNLTDTIVCDTFFVEAIMGMDLTGNEKYYEFTNGMGSEILVGDTITSDSTIYILDDTPGCVVEIPITIDVRNQFFAGVDSSLTVCEGDPILYNLNNQLGGGTIDTVGVWIEINTTGIVDDSSAVDFSSLAIGVYEFEYAIEDTICTNTSSVLTVNIVGSVDAGEDYLLPVCEDLMGVNVFDLIGNPDESGTFINADGTPAGFDPLDATFIADNSGLILYQYIIGDENSSCGADSSTLSVISGTSINAGEDNSSTICAGLTSLLSSLLNENSEIGYFDEPTVSGGLSNIGTFDSDLVDDGEYTVYHIVEGSGQCPNDTAILTLTIIDGPSAGDEMTIDICDEESIDLDDIIDGDSGGQYYTQGIPIPNSMIDLTLLTGSQEYLYIVGDGAACPFDTAIIQLNLGVAPLTTLNISNETICADECSTISILAQNTGANGITTFYSLTSTFGDVLNFTAAFGDITPALEITLCEGAGSLSDGFVMPGIIYTISVDSMLVENDPCIYIIDESVSVEVLAFGESALTGTYCTDAQVPVGSDIYTKDLTFGTTTIPAGSANGCDSIVMVDLDFQDVALGSYQNDLCEGDSDVVLGITYTSDFIGDSLLVAGSVNGCDSLVNITITFGEIEEEPYLETICAGDTTEVEGQQFFLGNEMDVITIPGGSASGCDKIVNVEITVDQTSMSVLDNQVCSNYSIEINNNTYDFNTQSGMEILEDAGANGCDSIVVIDLDFSLTAIDSTFTFSTCDDSYFLQIGSQTFNRSNPSGTADLTSQNGGCDTLLTIDLTFGQLFVDYMEVDAGCIVSDTGYVIIEDINGVAPFNITYNGNNTVAFVLPVEIALPIGTGQLTVLDGSLDPCEVTIPYEILEGEEGDFSISQQGNQLNIFGGTPDSISWSPADGLSCTDCIDPIATPEITTTYTATVYYGGECMLELVYTFEVENDVEDYILPSVFSPNNDGRNDNFTLFITEGVIGIPASMNIYDRWGNQVFTQIDPALITSEGWDGTWNNKDVTPGVYVYHITVIENEKIVNLYGDITVVR